MKVIGSFAILTIMAGMLWLPGCASSEWGDESADDYGPAGSSRDVLNPERGWYIARQTGEASPWEFAGFKKANVSLVLLEAYLGDYLSKPLDSLKLTEIDHAFDLARGAGLSVMFRAAYDFNGKSNPEPADFSIILNHIKQLGPVFRKHEDILFNIQAGFLGAWGEWHHSRYGDRRNPDGPPDIEYQRQLVYALLDEAPESVTIALRRPEFIRNIADNSKSNGERGDHEPVTRAEAFGTSGIARLSFHNDALMSDDTDMDTYIAPGYPREKELEWINSQTRYTPMVAESNLVSPYNDAERAIVLLDRINIHSLNLEYHPGVLKKWRRAEHNGITAFDYISMRMGYRFILEKAELSETPDGKLRLDFEVRNTGFGHLLKEKKFELVLTRDGVTRRAAIAEDARFWNKNETVKGKYCFGLPADMSPGDWNAYLGLSSVYASLAENSAYSVRFANDGVWVESLGLNKIGGVRIGAVPGNEREFKQIPAGN